MDIGLKSSIFSNEGVSRALRSVQKERLRINSRNKNFSIYRGMNKENVTSEEKETSEKNPENHPNKPLSQEEKLKKWKEEKNLKKILERESKRPLFKVGGPIQHSLPSIIPHGPYMKKIPCKVRGSFINRVEKFGRPNSIAKRMLAGNLSSKIPVKTDSVSKKTVKPVNKTAANLKLQPSFAPENFVFSPPHLVYNSEHYQEVFKPVKISTPIESGRSSENIVFKKEKANLLCQKSEILSVCTSTAKKTQTQNCDLKNGVSLCTPRRSMRLQDRTNRSELSADQNLFVYNTKQEIKVNSGLKNGESLCAPRRSPRLQNKSQQKVLAADKSSLIDNLKGINNGKSKKKNLISSLDHYRSNRSDHCITFEQDELSVFEDSFAVDTPVLRSQRTGLSEEFQRLTLEAKSKSPALDKQMPLMEEDMNPSLLYTPLRKTHSFINVEGDMMLFSPDI